MASDACARPVNSPYLHAPGVRGIYYILSILLPSYISIFFLLFSFAVSAHTTPTRESTLSLRESIFRVNPRGKRELEGKRGEAAAGLSFPLPVFFTTRGVTTPATAPLSPPAIILFFRFRLNDSHLTFCREKKGNEIYTTREKRTHFFPFSHVYL